jgi:hypothetical protein
VKSNEKLPRYLVSTFCIVSLTRFTAILEKRGKSQHKGKGKDIPVTGRGGP